jgi:hypothetical protein
MVAKTESPFIAPAGNQNQVIQSVAYSLILIHLFQLLWCRKDQLLVYLPHVDQMLYVENRMELALAPASQITWGILMKVVVQNVYSTQTVLLTMPVYAISVKILVQARVARIQTAKW